MAGDRRGGSPTAERRRGIRRLLLPRGEASSSSSSSVPLPPPAAAEVGRRKGFAAAALRGLGCTSAAASQAYAPGAGSAAAAAVRSSADWHGRRKKGKDKRKERGGGGGGGGGLVGGGIGGDVWCAPGIPFAAEASSVDCVVARHQMLGRGRGGDAERPHREIMMFQTRVLLGGMNVYDRYQDWRLDVDNMTYEELLELGERIGHVNTGLREDEIVRNLRKVKPDSSFQFPTEVEKKCSICQEEFEANDEMGRLGCGHSYHVYCIKQWLSQKNVCPVCKTAVTKT
ncbi:hypothetical protein CFC21_035894 [Triticum aestivum]|uniref:RING-type E3 ubiquitin transferase n=4 Tax=Triticum TaxID=4564 RepID=A0A9R0VL50_TRITD|nr:E3 ubiquitin-protein ligase MBR1-like isoform X2 [Triticum dicoccoides]XP_044341032.1 E3 ubiquitin-protein ligase MBR1-like isoform X2 [Triticum aestivum]XP_048564161.1 E3 ubiquitin-protein ligase MBR1-like isoform X2 [Triticum urartu]XP_048564170.1 E3 ubiquitin-protein ligase MBR1-like isoform X2 [Triticum urartu]VAH62986.1 unnamed protein product [Triticum turgidum subsp. durum]KAF7023367.1 hypothetical protein CFC21_035894 [Triticum aestivum]